MTGRQLLACALLFTLAALHGRKNAKHHFSNTDKSKSGAPLVGLLHTGGAR